MRYRFAGKAFANQLMLLPLIVPHVVSALGYYGFLSSLRIVGTHLGDFRGLPATGRAFRCRMLAVFLFEEDRLTCERVYFDANTILRQLGVAHDPLTVSGRIATVLNHPVTIGGAFLRRLRAGS